MFISSWHLHDMVTIENIIVNEILYIYIYFIYTLNTFKNIFHLAFGASPLSCQQ